MTDYLGYGYSALILVGGAVGYFKAGSLASLISGAVFGLAAGAASYQVSNNPKNVVFALVVSVLLLISMGIRFNKTGKFMPAGLITVLSLLMSLRYGSRLLQQ
ncbi:transmembrane protein 14C-like protein [Zychaea mexicana]|uniref:transmembrane protein 14C-like protein n=1 Tax=Zychaea mexicana TaxID=64656 RepID=UPI0022FEFADC|nr:transmembrane protein 14C-like protein [Zychaea mexicana]KAI9488749.1 transmembrane protein 14C-like protein [Zychaea mexicana]